MPASRTIFILELKTIPLGTFSLSFTTFQSVFWPSSTVEFSSNSCDRYLCHWHFTFSFNLRFLVYWKESTCKYSDIKASHRSKVSHCKQQYCSTTKPTSRLDVVRGLFNEEPGHFLANKKSSLGFQLPMPRTWFNVNEFRLD